MSVRDIEIDPCDMDFVTMHLRDVHVQLWVSTLDLLPVVQIDTGSGAHFRVNLNESELATVRAGGGEVELPEHSHEYRQRRSEFVDEELEFASAHLHAALRRHESAVLRKVSQLIREEHPTAASFKYDGEVNEYGLLHTYMRRILDADGLILDDIDNRTDVWDDLSDEVDQLMWEVSERDDSYAGDDKTLELTEEVG